MSRDREEKKAPDVITVLLADDQTSVRKGLRMRLNLEPDIEVVGEAGDGEEAIEMARELCPRVIVMDVEMPGMDGIAATTTLCGQQEFRVVMLSLHDDKQTRQRAADAGASGFVAKTRMDECLLGAIREAAAGS
jgi:DNA-binding NarL/FixJ family response regulator